MVYICRKKKLDEQLINSLYCYVKEFDFMFITKILMVNDGRPWSRRWRKSMENVEEKMKCSGIWRIRERLLSEMENLVKMKSRSGAMVWKVARGDEGES